MYKLHIAALKDKTERLVGADNIGIVTFLQMHKDEEVPEPWPSCDFSISLKGYALAWAYRFSADKMIRILEIDNKDVKLAKKLARVIAISVGDYGRGIDGGFLGTLL